MIRKSITLFALFFVLPFIIFGSENKTYKIACNENYYPYITKNENTGELEGIIIDYWTLWAQKTKVNIEFVPLNITDCIEKTHSGEVDIIAGLFYSDERSQVLDFTDPLFRMKTVLFLKKDNNPDSIQLITDTIGVLKDDLAHVHLKEKYPQIHLKVFEDVHDLQDMVQNKNINGFVFNLPNSLLNYKEVNLPKGYYIYETLYTQKLRAAVKSGNSNISNLVLSGSNSMTDEELFEIAEHWNLFRPNDRLLWILLVLGIVVGIVLALLISSFIKSKRKVKVLEDNLSKTDWQLIIDKGENDHIEFKSSLRWDMRLDKANKALEKVIAKTISAFLNTEGGMLFIGVDDDGNILGLEKDYNSMSKKNKDGFLLSLTNIVNVSLGKSVHKFLSINIISINDKDVCIVNVEKSDKPVFMGKIDNEEFYIRASASSQPLGVRETYKYINSHWS